MAEHDPALTFTAAVEPRTWVVSDEFDEKVVEDWIERLPSKRLQTITRMQMSRILEEADREASV